MTKCGKCKKDIDKPTQYRRGKEDLCRACFFELIYKYKAKSLVGKGR